MARTHYHGGSTLLHVNPVAPGRLSPRPLNGEQALTTGKAAKQQRAKADMKARALREKAREAREKENAAYRKARVGEVTKGWRTYTGVKYIDYAVRGFRHSLKWSRITFPKAFWEIDALHAEFLQVLEEASRITTATSSGRAHARKCMRRLVQLEKLASDLKEAN